MFFRILLFVILLSILCYDSVVVGAKKWQENVLSKYHGIPIRGFLTLIIIVHHVVQQMYNPEILTIFNEVGFLCVACFFFFSGYGLMYNTMNRDHYLSVSYFYKYISIVVPFYLTNICYLVYQTIGGQHYTFKDWIIYFLGFQLINTHAWFIILITIFYFIYYIIFKFIHNQNIAIGCLFIFLILYIFICLSRGSGTGWFQGEWWFNSCILFGIGVLFSRFERIILLLCKKIYIVLFPFSITIFIWFWEKSIVVLDKISYLSADNSIFSPLLKESYICLFWQMSAVISFVIFVFLLTLKFQSDNIVLRFFAKISLELYLIHGVFIKLFHSDFIMIENDMLYLFCVVICSIAAAWLLNYPVQIVEKGVLGLFKNKQ